MAKLQSAVIVKNEHGSVATLRFDNPKFDVFFSSPSKKSLYIQIENYVAKVDK